MNQSVSGVDHNVRFFRSTTFVLGLVQGGELVTARATALIKGPFRHSGLGPITQLAAREVEGLQVRYPRGSGNIFPEIR